MTTLSIHDIPPEVFSLFLKPLPLEEVVKAGQVCKQWKQRADDVIKARAKLIIGGDSSEELTKFKQLCQDVKSIKGMVETTVEDRLDVISKGALGVDATGLSPSVINFMKTKGAVVKNLEKLHQNQDTARMATLADPSLSDVYEFVNGEVRRVTANDLPEVIQLLTDELNRQSAALHSIFQTRV